MIELSHLNHVKLSADKSVVSIGPGLRWGAVYDALDASGVTAIGGRIPNVGVGGLILSGESQRNFLLFLGLQTGIGGLSHFSAQFGLAADNVKNFEVGNFYSDQGVNHQHGLETYIG